MKKFLLWIILLHILFASSEALYENSPKIFSRDGNLIFETGEDKNIVFRMRGRGSFNVNDVNLIRTLQGAQNSSSNVFNNFDQVMLDLVSLKTTVQGSIIPRIRALEGNTTTSRLPWRPPRPATPPSSPLPAIVLSRLRRRISTLETKVATVMRKLEITNCTSNPCQNGGTCLNMYDGFFCMCTKGYQGQTCAQDVNECAEFVGVPDSGCQNGATCQNTMGSYICLCAPGFVGTHCRSRNADCLTSGVELCDKGACVQTNDAVGYKCICDQGWKSNGLTPACTVDIDECTEAKPHCSLDPPVSCVNLPGSFMCGSCPPGFTGNGFYCIDINECESNNGGCSSSPMVRCINTRGSSRCGRCPEGYEGDGRTCFPKANSVCAAGICHPMATCTEYQNSVVNCICKPGYTGRGFGADGCTLDSNAVTCNSNVCQNGGTCTVQNSSVTCICPQNTLPPFCEFPTVCNSSPCQNGGTCRANVRRGQATYSCACPSGFIGTNCQTRRRRCGGLLQAVSGNLKFPADSDPYQHNTRCAWMIQTNKTLVLNITFKSFELERPVANNCKFDWLQIHDGPSSSSHMVGRFCGFGLPRGGNIISSQNSMYLWFRSDNSSSHDGFELDWTSILPDCGGQIETNSHGTIASPGSPGPYPMDRDCFWKLVAPQGKRVQLNFFLLSIEAHESCAYDFLAIYDGLQETSPLIEKFCNTSTPEPLLTPNNEVMLHFHSDGDNNDRGFQIAYSVVPGTVGCGGVLTDIEGQIMSPLNYEDRTYPHNLECEFLIRQPLNTRIRIDVLSFHLEESDECKFDFVEIYEGKTTESQLIGRFCGTSIPKSFVSENNFVLIKFKSDWSTSHSGFSFKYRAVCGGRFGDSSGTISSPFYPEPYRSQQLCLYEIEAPIGSSIELEFQDFDMEGSSDCAYDFLEVFDGHQSNISSLGRYCGLSRPNKVVSSFNLLTLLFQSDQSVSGRGFKANYSVVAKGCGGIVRTSKAVIDSGNNGAYYDHNLDCRWLLAAPDGFSIQLNWKMFDLENSDNCQYDFVEVFDNSTAGSPTVGKYCSDRIPSIMTIAGNLAMLHFKTDSSNANEGFTVEVNFLDSRNVCGGDFHSPSGYVRSPGWPAPYYNSKSCIWKITVQSGRQIELNFKNFTLEPSSECRFDRLEVRNGGLETSPLLGTFCGTTFPPVLRSFSNQMYISFVSDSSRNDAGFEIEWTSAATGCGGILTSYRGAITSPHYPAPYSENALCGWRIAVSGGAVVQIVFSDIDLEGGGCAFDYVEVFDGKDVSGRSMGKFCESDSHPLALTSTSNFAYIRFVSDNSQQGRGFQLRYTALCNITIRDQQNGVIESPNFPEPYPHNLQCEWTIMGTRGNKLYLEFTHFELEQNSLSNSRDCIFDYVEIVQYLKNDTVGSNKYCNSKPAAFTSIGDSVLIRFVSDVNGRDSGWRLEWNVEGCGGILTKPKGALTTPNYPNAYTHGQNCEWKIVTDYGNSIVLNIHNLDTEQSQDCRFDGLEVRAQDQIIAKMCHFDTNHRQIVGHGHEMIVKFYSDESLNYGGLNATYEAVPSKCGGKLTAVHGGIFSPNYPKIYDKNETCEWQITVDANHRVQFNILDFDLELSDNCEKDSLYIFDGPIEDANRILLRLCGNNLPNKTSYTSTSNEMLVVFKADSDLEYKGFKANYTTACGSRIVTDGSGTIHVTDAVKSYSPNCTWTIIADDLSKHVTLTVSHVTVLFMPSPDMDCFLYVKVTEGESTEGPERATICKGKAPPTIVSNGNSLTIHMGQNSSESVLENIIGLDFLAHYTVLDNACGGTLNSFEGSLASPNYPFSYPLDSECVWEIKASAGNTINLNIENLNIESSDDCSSDYLEVRDVSNIGKVLKVLCGSVSGFQASGKSLWLKFRSGKEGAGTGFLAEYAYGTHNEIAQSEGYIESVLYPKNYISPYKITYRVTVPFGFHILFTFDELRFGNGEYGDFRTDIKIYDGFDEASALLSPPIYGLSAPDPMKSSSNVAFIVVTKIEYDMFLGQKFKLSYKAVEPSEVKLPDVDGCSNVQVALNVSSALNITSPGYPNGYGSGLNCTWTITSTDPLYHPVLYFADVDLEDTSSCAGDYIQVSASKDLASWREIGKMCNSNFNGPYYHNAFHGNPYLRFSFFTDWYNNRTGFVAMNTLACGGELTGPNGVIETPKTTGNPVWLGYSGVCMYNISVRPGRMIKFEFEEFNFPKIMDKCGASIIFKNGQDDDSPLLGDGKFCGTEFPVLPLTSSRYAFVKYTNIFTGHQDVRFRFKYQEVSPECGRNIILTENYRSEVISSPNFPNIPHPFSECVWTFMAPAGESITITFIEKFDLTLLSDCKREYVELRDGGVDRSQLMEVYCGFKIPPPTTTTSNMLRVKFFTEVNDPKTGFKANVSISSCGGLFQSSTGIIKSPGYGVPGAYPPNTVCEFRIRGRSPATIVLSIIDLDLPNNCELDHIEVYSVMVTDFQRINDQLVKHGDYCGEHFDKEIRGNSNEMLIRFKTFGANTVYKGFMIKYNLTKSLCGQEITADSGTITSPGYPSSLVMAQVCEWKITVPKGRRVSARVIDYDIGSGSSAVNRIIFYNGINSNIRIKTISSNDTGGVIRSSDNKMLIFAWSRPSSMNRGFKIEFNSDEATICEGSLDDATGSIYAPKNETSYMCQYPRSQNFNGTLAMYFSNIKAGHTSTSKCALSASRITTSWPSCPRKDENILSAYCGSEVNEATVLSPFKDFVLEAKQSSFGGVVVDFNMNYAINRCGGLFSGAMRIENPSPNPVSGGMGPIGCAWYVQQREGVTMNVNVSKMNMTLTCDREYLQLYNGPTQSSPHFTRYCGKNIPTDSINTQSNYLFIEYISESYNPSSEFVVNVVPTAAACGGIIHKPIYTISSPGNGTYYNNMECIWEIRADPGFGINLWFKDRFYIEESANCTKDYVEILVAESEDVYISKGRFCGRQHPPAFNTSASRVHVKIHTDGDIKGDGFTIEWKESCGGIFKVSADRKVIVSPNHPRNYPPNLKCNYTLYTEDPEGYVNLNFNSFSLEDSRGRCRYDNVTIYHEKEYHYGDDYWDRDGSFCRNDSPGLVRHKKKVVVLFQTDRWHEKSGFLFEYYTDTCGGNITTSQTIEPPKKPNSDEILPNSKCVWHIYAPRGQNIIIRLEEIRLESSMQCWYDQLSIFTGLNVTDNGSRKAKLCGNITNSVIDLESSIGSIQFTNDGGRNEGHFKVVIIMKLACSSVKNLTSSNPTSETSYNVARPLTPNSDCHLKLLTDPGFVISTSFTNFHVSSCSRNISCDCNYVEIRDGPGPFASLIGTYCGHEAPQPIVSSGSSLWVRFVRDSSNGTFNVELKFSREMSFCGASAIVINKTEPYVLRAPSFGGLYRKNLRCHWIFERDDYPSYGYFYIDFRMVDIQDANQNGQCTADFLRITDGNVKDFMVEGLGEETIFRGAGVYSSAVSFFSGSYSALQPHTYCGSGIPVSYYASGEKLHVTFESDGETEKRGFELQISASPLCRDFKELSGRIHNTHPKNCEFIIEVPENFTVAIFFQNVYFYDNDCNKSGLLVYDGLAVTPSTELCSYTIPNAFFSTGNRVRVVIKVTDSNMSSGSYDLTYIASDKGRGCGGKIFNYGGTFTSPLYPENTREEADCYWDIAVPNNVKVALRFSTFDLGSKLTCADNFVQIIETNERGEKQTMRQYCGGDVPSIYRSDKNVIEVRFKKTVNFGGSGFVANFIGVHENTHVYEW